MIIAGNHAELASRMGFPIDGNYTFMKCTGCGEFALYQDEIDSFLLTPDFKYNVFSFVGEPPTVCPRCGAVDALVDCVDADREDIWTSAWAFAL